MLIVFSLLLFLAVTATAYLVWAHGAAERDPVAVRMRSLRARQRGSAVGFGEPPSLAVDLIARLGGFLPERDGRDALRTGLVSAGFRHSKATLVFLGSKILCAAILPLVWLAFVLFTGRPMAKAAPMMLLLVGVGFYLPSFVLSWIKRERQSALSRALPDALDLMVVCVEAGLGLTAALQRVADEFRFACRPLADELTLVHQEMQAGVPREEALRNLAKRTGIDDIYSLVAMLIQTDRLGTSIAQALRAHAESMRTRRKQRAEQLARKASIKLAFPLVFLVLPALLVIILGPAGIQLVKALVAE